MQCRLKLLKNKRRCIVKQVREDVAQLLKHGHHQSAFQRVLLSFISISYFILYWTCKGMIYRLSSWSWTKIWFKCMIYWTSFVNLLYLIFPIYADTGISTLSYPILSAVYNIKNKSNLIKMCRYRDCPNDINEAVSTLIFSSARFGELPELLPIRKLFGERYNQRFVTIALELLPGNLVNNQVNC